MRLKSAFILILLMVCVSAWAQNGDSLKPYEDIQIIFGKKARPRLDVDYQFSALSKDWSSQQLYDFASAGFIDENAKQDLLDRTDDFLNFGAIQSWEISFVYQAHRRVKLLPIPKASVYLFNRSYTGMSLSKDLVELAFRGNKPFAGQSIENQSIAFQNWFYSGLGFQFGITVDTIPISVGIALTTVHDYNSVGAEIAQFSTTTNGTSIDFDGSYQYLSSQANFDYDIEGIGFALDLSSSETWGLNQLDIGIQDFGWVYFNGLEQIERDTSFSFRGLQLGNLFRPNDGLVDEQRDSISGALGGSKAVESWQLLPFRASMEYRRRLRKKSAHSLGLALDYLYLPSYSLRSEVYHSYSFGDMQLRSGIAYGGFTNWALNLQLFWDFAEYWEMRLALQNINGLVFPNNFNGAGAFASLRYYF